MYMYDMEIIMLRKIYVIFVFKKIYEFKKMYKIRDLDWICIKNRIICKKVIIDYFNCFIMNYFS